ncbi:MULTISPECIES: gamma-glutamyl-gamma-aminobutyrate hydrolase family protein [Acidobacterium]|uniref:Class-I glutamine amidotransferase family protein n=1 Tax=Acidobacterium capsulatum (strain ATCC 51196 / DSM 11244 / BCRC 80197 / JCM 7670 / NBRC 15755 / NCIMB 13165 / 161) TaxID=240015 RepID=C1F9L4_ACIC5|nr:MULTISPECIES: gamma-glutamyl-gamma-aminobutyrate hydrolase family protein [Acidobacterium]ACO34188.1 class-I glutamine amidotransferase family protein [Acidobacterium capsulatum ATCC 51196]HCT62221.1 gamma-glutamyl-gamma-aminobutyrate hydrolase family protein [Acidobacterium sp.]
MTRPRIAIPEPTLNNAKYNERSWIQYANAVEAAGGEPVKIALSAAPAEIARTLASCQGVLLPGSPADVNPAKFGEAVAGAKPEDPAREAADELLLQDAFNLRKPVLGICYGFQSMNVWLGGSLVQDLPTQRPDSPVNHSPKEKPAVAHTVRLAEGSRLVGLAGQAESPVNSSHHQAVARLGDGLVLAGSCPEDGVIEAAEGRTGAYVMGLQWHPERTLETDAFSRRIFESFLEAVKAWKEVPNGAGSAQ